MKINLLSLSFGLLTLAFPVSAAEILFKDGTKINADLFDAKPEGVVLLVGGKVYIHHYPVHADAFAPPGKNAYDNPFYFPSCAPTRISFFHFSRKTQDELMARYNKAGTPRAKAISEKIEQEKYLTPKDLDLVPTAEKSYIWLLKVSTEFCYQLDTQKAVLGKNLK